MSKNKDGWEKNLDEVEEGADDMVAEWKETWEKIQVAAGEKDIRRVLHHCTDFRGACQEHMWKFHFYAFWPKWLIVGGIMWCLYHIGLDGGF
jgi:hypothetical protein